MPGDGVMTLAARVVRATAGKLDRDDVQIGVVVGTLSSRPDVHATHEPTVDLPLGHELAFPLGSKRPPHPSLTCARVVDDGLERVQHAGVLPQAGQLAKSVVHLSRVLTLQLVQTRNAQPLQVAGGSRPDVRLPFEGKFDRHTSIIAVPISAAEKALLLPVSRKNRVTLPM
jgi:hypothetical protein